MSTQNLPGIIQQYTAQKNTCEAEVQKLTTEVAVLESNLNSLLATAKEKFGTDDINNLNTILLNLTTESEALQQELNNLNSGVQGQSIGQMQYNGVQGR